MTVSAKIVSATPREIMAQGAWEKLRDILGWGQWVFDGGLKSLDEPLWFTADQARQAGYVPPSAPRWQLNRDQLATLGNSAGAFLAAWGATRILQHRAFGLPLLAAGLLAMVPQWIMLARSIHRRRRTRAAHRQRRSREDCPHA